MPEKPTPIQVVTWNVNRRKASVLDALKDLPQLDVLTLQEVTFNQRKEFQKRLAVMGLKWCCPDCQRRTRDKDYGILIASRWKIDPVETRYSGKGPPWSELLVQASVPVNSRSFLECRVSLSRDTAVFPNAIFVVSNSRHAIIQD